MVQPKSLILGVVLLLIFTAGVSSGQRGSPDLSVLFPENQVSPGEETILQLYLLNGGDVDVGSADPTVIQRITTARNVQVSIEAGRAPIEVETGTRPVGNVPEGVSEPIGFTVSVADDATPGDYQIPVRIEYKYTRQISGEGDQRVHQESETVVNTHVTLRIEDAPVFEITGTESSAKIGETGTLSLTIRNIGTEPARDASVVIDSTDTELTFGTDSAESEVFIGQWVPTETKQIEFKVGIADTAIRRNYSVDVTVEYTDPDGIPRESETLTTGIYPRPKQSFAIVSSSSTAEIGGTGLLSLDVRNTGPDTVYETTITTEFVDPDIGFANGATQSETFIGRWAPGTTKSIEYRIQVSDNAVLRNYSMRAAIGYQNEIGTEPPPITILGSLVPQPEQTFALQDISSDLRVDSTGRITAELVNTGSSPVRDVVVIMGTGTTNLTPRSGEFAVGSLGPGETASVRFTVDVPGSINAGPRRVPFVVEYRDGASDTRRTDEIDVQLDIGTQQDVFGLSPTSATFPVDSTGQLVIEVTNNEGESIRDIETTLVVEEPLTSDDSRAFISELEPGESTEIAFRLEVSDDAIPKTHPVSVEMVYEDTAGTVRTAGPYRVGVDVIEQPGTGFPIIPLLAIIVVFAFGGYWWWRKREDNVL